MFAGELNGAPPSLPHHWGSSAHETLGDRDDCEGETLISAMYSWSREIFHFSAFQRTGRRKNLVGLTA